MGLGTGVFRGGVGVISVWAISAVLLSDLTPTPFGGYADQRFLQIWLSGMLVVGSILFFFFRPPLHRSLVYTLLPSTLLALAFPLLAGSFSGQSYVWVEPGMYAFYFLAFPYAGVALSGCGSAVGFAKFLTLLAAVGCFLYGAMSINVYLFALFDGVTDLVDFLPWGFVNIRYWSHVATWLLPLLPLAVLVGPMKKYRLWRIIVTLGAGLWWWLLFLSAARGSVLGILFGVVLMFLLVGRQSLPWVKVFFQFLVIGMLIWLVLSVLIPSFFVEGMEVRSISSDSAGRTSLFVEAWHMSLQNFPFGMGPQSWLTHEILTSAYKSSHKFGHPHNMYLMWAAEYGWLLIFLLVILSSQAIKRFWRRRNRVLMNGDQQSLLLLVGFSGSVSAALFHSGVSAVFTAPGSMLVGLFVLIGFWSLIQPQFTESETAVVRKPTLTYKLISVLVVGFVVAIWMAWTRQVIIYYNDMRSDESFYHELSGGRTYPRFWLHGNFPRPEGQMPKE